MGSWIVTQYDSEDGDDVDEEADEPQADPGPPQKVVNQGQCPRKCEDWTAYLRSVIYDHCEGHATASNLNQAKCVFYKLSTSSW